MKRRDLVDELGEEDKSLGLPDLLQEWVREMYEYNVPGGKLNRGLTVVDGLKSILGRALDDSEYKRAAVLGWCIEWLQVWLA